MGLCFILTGHYLNLIVFTSLILTHELGHYLTATILKFNVDKIIIYPYGGITKINDLINRDINEELLIATSGIIFQFMFFILIYILYKYNLIREYTFNLYTIYNNRMIFFNLLPIYPLDGSKIINLLFQKIFNYNLSNKLIIIISISTIILLILLNIYKFNYSNIMIYSILFGYIYDLFKKRKYLYNRFLLERYLYNIKYKKIKIINRYDKMYKNKSHIIYNDKKYIEESKYLKMIFSSKIS